MVEQPYVLETPPVKGESLRCAFTRSGDRFVHKIESLINGETTLMFSSVEDEGDELRPPSPPWQELHVHQQPDGSSALMLVGRAGKSHWSMSVTVDDNSPAIVFDVACRIHETPGFLGCTYDDYRRTSLQPVQIIALSPDGLQTRPTIQSTDGRVVIDATQGAEPPTTLRWRYEVALV